MSGSSTAASSLSSTRAISPSSHSISSSVPSIAFEIPHFFEGSHHHFWRNVLPCVLHPFADSCEWRGPHISGRGEGLLDVPVLPLFGHPLRYFIFKGRPVAFLPAICTFFAWHRLYLVNISSPVANKLFVNSKFTTCFWVAWFFCKLHNSKFELCCVFMTLVTCRRHCSDAVKVPVFLSVLAFICMPWPKANIGSKTKNADAWGNIQIKNRLTNDNWAASSCTWPVAWRNWEACTLPTRSIRKL